MPATFLVFTDEKRCVSSKYVALISPYNYFFQDSSRIRELLNDKKNGIVYLEDQKHTFHAKEGGREWSVYGFPVS